MTTHDDTNEVIEENGTEEEQGVWCDNCQTFHPAEPQEPTDDEIREILAAQGATSEQIDAFLQERADKKALFERINALVETADLNDTDAELLSDPDELIAAFATAIGDAENSDKLIGILALIVGTNIQLSETLQGIQQQMLMQQVYSQLQQQGGGGEQVTFVGFDD